MAPGTYTVTVTDKFGCKGTETIVIATSGSMPSVTQQSENSSGCGESNGSFVIMQENPALTYNYTLLDENGKSIGTWANNNMFKNDGTFSLGDLSAGRYNVSVVNDDGCEKIVTVDISDEDGPDIMVGASGVKHITCYGQADGSITVSLENGGTNPAYLWNDPDQSTTPSILDLASGVYTVKVTNDEGCTAVASFQVREPARLLANASLNHLLCAGDNNGSIQLSISGGSLPMSFIWNTGATTRNISNLQAGVYTVAITDINYCTFTNSYTITAPDQLSITHQVNDVMVGEGNGSIQVSVSGGVGPYSYSWDTGQDTPYIDGLQAGSYTITITDANDCELVETITVGTVNVPLVKQNELIRLYPNPARNELYVDFSSACISVATLELYNIAGEKVYANVHPVSDGADERYRINVNNLQPGVYIVRLRCAEQTWQSKFIKQ
jgi:hypothetical protein